MNDLQDAINEFRQAVEEYAKRVAARKVGAAIGAIIGASAYPHKKTEAEIDAMSLSQLETWVNSVEMSPPPEPPPQP